MKKRSSQKAQIVQKALWQMISKFPLSMMGSDVVNICDIADDEELEVVYDFITESA